jgi:hypothetical protein
MNRNKIVLGLGIIVFIVGFIFVSLVSFFLNTRVIDVNNIEVASELKSMFESESQYIHTMGLWSLLGLALISIGIIMILLVKTEKS